MLTFFLITSFPCSGPINVRQVGHEKIALEDEDISSSMQCVQNCTELYALWQHGRITMGLLLSIQLAQGMTFSSPSPLRLTMDDDISD